MLPKGALAEAAESPAAPGPYSAARWRGKKIVGKSAGQVAAGWTSGAQRRALRPVTGEKNEALNYVEKSWRPSGPLRARRRHIAIVGRFGEASQILVRLLEV